MNPKKDTTDAVPSLQELNKQAQKKEADLEAARSRCKVCFKETAPKRQCGGHGGGGGGEAGGGGAGSDDTESKGASDSFKGEVGSAEAPDHSVVDNLDIDAQPQLDDARFNPEIIAQLIADNRLVVDNNRESMTLTIQLQCKPEALSQEEREELKKFMTAILEELKAFTEENDLSLDCVNIIRDTEDNILSLQIKLPTQALYDAFIQRLENNLVPVFNPLLKQPEEDEQEIFNPSPFSMKPGGW